MVDRASGAVEPPEEGYAAVPRELIKEILEVGNDVLNGDADVSELDDLLARLHQESA